MASRSHSRPELRSPMSSASSTSLMAPDPSGEYKWNSFEIRTLVCLIIKGAHYDRKGPVDPMDFADKLNKALNPVQATNERSRALFDRDIPVDEVQKMMRRILAKKRHAVDVVQRDPAAAITKRQVNAFMRQLDFDGGQEEWIDGHRRQRVMAERSEMRRQLNKREDGRPVSQERWQDNQERLRDIQSPRAQRLLSNWSIGRTFFEGELYQHCGRWTQADGSSRTPGTEPIRGRTITRRGRSASPGEITDISGTTYNGAGEGKGYNDPFSTYNGGSKNGSSSWDNTVQTPAWGTPGHSMHRVAATPNPPVGGWGGGFGLSASTPQLDGANEKGYGYGSAPPTHGSSDMPANTNQGYGRATGGGYPAEPGSSKMPSYGAYKSG